MNALNRLKNITMNPKAELKEAVASGKKVIGIMPYFCPEELVYAAGMLPFGLWGAEMQANESKQYYPAFICSILHTTLEMGLKGELDDLSAVMIPISCDSLKGMGANWEAGVKNVPVINVAFAENRKIAAGIEFTRSQFRKIQKQIEEIAGRTVSDDEIRKAITIYNENRCAILAFSKAAATHPAEVTAADRCAAIKAGYFMDRAAHTELLNEVTAELENLPASDEGYLKIVTTGIIADAPRLLDIIDKNKMVIVDDQIAHESVNARYVIPEAEDPVLAMAERLAEIEGCSVLYDPGKKRGTQLVEMAKNAGADGILFILTKFCDPEEYDYVPVKRMTDSASIPMLQIEIDQQMTDYGQPESAIMAFAESLR
ncbi:MAG: 2-hydroxyacyl-CoA dehydratase [Lachnospiraceae bacterium]|nr:2-hydroxyacyl-CoA dehydratase [Lachnospiraceae bacterium]